MSRDRYIDAIRALCKLLGLQDPNSIVEGAPLAVGDVMFSLLYGAQANPNAIIGYCDFGEIPPGKEAQVYQSLLSNNFVMYDGKGPCFAISPGTGRVILAMHYDLGKLAPESLLDSLTKVATCAREWRTHQFLTPRATFPGAATARGGNAPDGSRSNASY
jgi:hypothetical protein